MFPFDKVQTENHLKLTETLSLFVPVKLEFSPTLKKLEENVDMLPQLIGAIAEFKRLPEIISCRKSQDKPIYISIGLCLQRMRASALSTGEGRNVEGRPSAQLLLYHNRLMGGLHRC